MQEWKSVWENENIIRLPIRYVLGMTYKKNCLGGPLRGGPLNHEKIIMIE